ncbi:hypothetical protein COLU111180_11990 [Cohnella lubricantis]|nr:hypothetical protein [Cohnella lubricantis]MBP2117903.1 hypothetical protein [Cohnella lubricantis]
MCEGYNLRVEAEMQRLAWHAANLMNVHLKKQHRVTADQLLGKGKKRMTPEDRESGVQKLREQIARMKGGH